MTFAALSAFAEEFLALRRSAARHDPRQQGVELRYLKHREKLLRGFLLCWRNCGCPWPIPSSLLLDWIAVGADRQHPYRDQHRYYTVRAFSAKCASSSRPPASPRTSTGLCFDAGRRTCFPTRTPRV